MKHRFEESREGPEAGEVFSFNDFAFFARHDS
jgi:hypothetical protein